MRELAKERQHGQPLRYPRCPSCEVVKGHLLMHMCLLANGKVSFVETSQSMISVPALGGQLLLPAPEPRGSPLALPQPCSAWPRRPWSEVGMAAPHTPGIPSERAALLERLAAGRLHPQQAAQGRSPWAPTCAHSGTKHGRPLPGDVSRRQEEGAQGACWPTLP